MIWSNIVCKKISERKVLFCIASLSMIVMQQIMVGKSKVWAVRSISQADKQSNNNVIHNVNKIKTITDFANSDSSQTTASSIVTANT